MAKTAAAAVVVVDAVVARAQVEETIAAARATDEAYADSVQRAMASV